MNWGSAARKSDSLERVGDGCTVVGDRQRGKKICQCLLVSSKLEFDRAKLAR